MAREFDDTIVHRTLDTAASDPALEIVQHVSDLKDTDVDELRPYWHCVDGMLEQLFSDPPADQAQLEVTFSYEGFRISVDQEGVATFVELG